MSPVSHHRQQATQKAADWFWAKGFHATPMRSIRKAMDKRPGSIYASFGSKEGLFKGTRLLTGAQVAELMEVFVNKEAEDAKSCC